jgi:hypothetical protein
MYKGTIMITNKGIGFKLINSTSFDETVFSAGYIEKTIKLDLHVRINHPYPPRSRHQKTLEDTKAHHTEAGGETPPGPTCRPPSPLGPLVSLSSQCRFSTAS